MHSRRLTCGHGATEAWRRPVAPFLRCRETHWKQCQLITHARTPPQLQQDDRVRGTITIDKRSGTQRELSLHVVYAGGSGVVGPSTHDLRITSGLAL